jgi:hypothetical protein
VRCAAVTGSAATRFPVGLRNDDALLGRENLVQLYRNSAFEYLFGFILQKALRRNLWVTLGAVPQLRSVFKASQDKKREVAGAGDGLTVIRRPGKRRQNDLAVHLDTHRLLRRALQKNLIIVTQSIITHSTH